jgi:hypothetical protein
MGFTIGRGRYATQTYPETGGSSGGGELSSARNSAYGPISPQGFSSIAPIDWAAIEVGGAPGGTTIPITPVSTSTGRVRVIAVVGVEVVTDDSQIGVAIEVNGTPSSPDVLASVTVGADSSLNIPILVDLDLSSFGPGPTYHISVNVQAVGAGVATLGTRQSSIDIQELPAATG